MASSRSPSLSPRRVFILLFLSFTLFTCVILFHSVLHIQEEHQGPSALPPAIKLPPRYNPSSSPSSPSSPSSSLTFRGGATPLILYYTAVSGFMGKTWLKPPKNCSVLCEFTETASRYEESDASVFLLPAFSQGSSFPKKHEGQKFVGLSMESELYYTHMTDKKFMSNFDIKMTYRQSAEITTMYMSSKANYSDTPITKTKEALISIFVSNSGPLNQRNEAIREIMDRVPCHSYGRYLRNVETPKDESKKSILRKYKFHLAFENSNTVDYVTEKVFQALAAGTLPSAPNIDQYMPSNRSIIKLSDFGNDYDKLANYIKFLDENDDEYQKYFEWKLKPYTGNFLKLKNYIQTDARCKLCMKLYGLDIPKLEDILDK